MRTRRVPWLQIVFHVAALTPLVLLVWNFWQGRFIIDPVKEITTLTGKAALILLLVSLAMLPLSILTGVTQFRRASRPLGLYAFMYAGLHFLTFVGLDYRFDFDLIGDAIFRQRYVIAGFLAGFILLILAITSTRGWQKRLGKNWKRLHRLVYLAAILAVVHFLWLVKDIREPMRYAIVLVILLLLRLPPATRVLARIHERLSAYGEGKPAV